MTEEKIEENEETTELKIIDKRVPLEPEAVLPEDQTMSVVLVALNKGYTPELVEKMMALQERFEANEARKAFHLDLAAFNEVAPAVTKDKTNKAFSDAKYTSLGNLLNTYSPVLGKFGLSVSFPTPAQTDTSMTVYCRLSHRTGHSETVSIMGPVAASPVGKESGKKARNPLQDIKATFTYLRSATCEAVLGVAGTEGTVNDNGNTGSSSVEFITEEQAKALNKELAAFPDEGKAFLEFIGAETVDTISAGAQYKKALLALKKEKAKSRSPGEDG